MCQRKEESKMRKRIIAAVLMAVLACIMLVGCDGNTVPEISEEAYKAQCRQMDYKELFRYPEKYKGTKVMVKVRVAQIIDANLFGSVKAWRTYTDNSGYGFYADDEYYMLDKRWGNTVKILTDDIVVVYGEFTGLEEVTRALTGTTDELPRIVVRYADLAK